MFCTRHFLLYFYLIHFQFLFCSGRQFFYLYFLLVIFTFCFNIPFPRRYCTKKFLVNSYIFTFLRLCFRGSNRAFQKKNCMGKCFTNATPVRSQLSLVTLFSTFYFFTFTFSFNTGLFQMVVALDMGNYSTNTPLSIVHFHFLLYFQFFTFAFFFNRAFPN